MIYMVPHNCVRLNFRVRLTKPFKNFTYYETSGKGIVVFFIHRCSWIDAFTLPICFSACNYIITISCANWGYDYLLHRDFPYEIPVRNFGIAFDRSLNNVHMRFDSIMFIPFTGPAKSADGWSTSGSSVPESYIQLVKKVKWETSRENPYGYKGNSWLIRSRNGYIVVTLFVRGPTRIVGFTFGKGLRTCSLSFQLQMDNRFQIFWTAAHYECW